MRSLQTKRFSQRWTECRPRQGATRSTSLSPGEWPTMDDSLFVTVAGSDVPAVCVRLPVNARANERWVERVRPALDLLAAAIECSKVFEHAALSVAPPSWLGQTSQRPAMYLILGDIAMPLDPDPADRARLVTRTVLTRAGLARPERRIARRRRRQVKHAERADRRESRRRRAPHHRRPTNLRRH